MRNKTEKHKAPWFIFLICSTALTIMSALNGWPIVSYFIIWGLAALVSFFTLNSKIDVVVQAYSVTIFAMADIFMCSVLEENVYPSIIVMCGCSILIATYKRQDILFIQSAMSLATILLHAFFFKTVDLSTISQIAGFATRILVLLMSQLFLIHFISVLNKTENELKDSLIDAKAAENSKSDFLSNMSHELRTPMNAILGMCELMLQESNIDDNAKEYCYNIKSSSKSLLEIISDILDFSKMESGEMVLTEEEFDMASIINDVTDTAINRIGDKKIEFIVHVDPDLPKGIIGDEFRIRQVILNLVSNAIKYTRSGAIILDVSFSTQKYGINLSVSVRDTGIGISPEHFDKLFMRFHQVNNSKKRSSDGIGLGLAISKQLVTIMGGFIDVSSEYGVGSEFRFTVPLGVSNDAPFAFVNNPDDINVAAYFDTKRFTNVHVPREYKKLSTRINESLKTRYTFNNSLDKLKNLIQNEKITHCFTGREEYVRNSAYFDKISEEMIVYVIQNRNGAIKLNGNVKTIFKPFYVLNCAAALNSTSAVLAMNEQRRGLIKFSAPSAKVLVVDDNLVNLKVASGLMRPYGVQVFTAESGESAISVLRSKNIDLVFMDHMMPSMDGVETMHKIRSINDDYYKQVPIIALTANAVNGTREVLLSEGFDDFMTKPIELSALDRVLSTYIPEELMEAPIDKINTFEPKTADMVKPVASALLDTAEGLLYTGDDYEIYRDILSLFVRESTEKRSNLTMLCELGDWKNYIIAVHALKSAAKNIGADSLSELAKELEFAGKAGNFAFIKEKNQSLTELIGSVSDEAERFLISNSKAASDSEALLPEIDRDKLAKHAVGIIRACGNFDGDEIEKNFNILFRHSFGGVNLNVELEKAAAFASEFEYEAASDEIKEFLRKIGGNE